MIRGTPGTEELAVGTNGEKQIQIAAFVEKKRPTEDNLVIRTFASGPQRSCFSFPLQDLRWISDGLIPFFFLTKAFAL